MSFDPYYQWLGIPPHEQPPNHYRLLGLALFESNLDVISTAADRQMAHVRAMQSGQNGGVSQIVLNEISAARICLLNPFQKTAYDQHLLTIYQVQFPSHALVVGMVPTTVPPQMAVDDQFVAAPSLAPPHHADTRPTLPIVVTGSSERAPREVRPKAKPPSGTAAKIAEIAKVGFGGVAGVSIAILILWLGFKNDPLNLFTAKSTDVAKLSPTAPRKSPPASQSTRPARDKQPAGGSSQSRNRSRTSVIPNKPVSPSPPEVPLPHDPRPLQPVSEKPNPASDKPPGPATPLPSPAPSPSIESSTPTSNLELRPIPSDVPLAAARSVLRDLFKSKYDAAFELKGVQKYAELADLSQELLDVAADESDDASRFATLELAGKIAVSSGSVELSLKTVDALALVFKINAAEQRLDTLRRVIGTIIADQSIDRNDRSIRLQRWMARLLDLASIAEAEMKFAEAVELYQLAVDQLPSDPTIADGAQLDDRLHQSRAKVSRQQQFRKSFAELMMDPDDEKLHYVVGIYYCFDLDDWDKGLPHLVRGSDAKLIAAAQLEIQGAESSAAMEALGDSWWEIAALTLPEHRQHTERRAIHWYRKALPQAKGLTKVRIGTRLARV